MFGTLDKVRKHSLWLSVSGETLRRLYYVSNFLIGVNWIAPQERPHLLEIDTLPRTYIEACASPVERNSRLLVSQVSFGEAVNQDLSRKGIKHEDDYSCRC